MQVYVSFAQWFFSFQPFTMGFSIELYDSIHGIQMQMEESMQKIDTNTKEAAYHAWLGYYNSIAAIGRDKTTLVELANQFSASMGLEKPPALYRKTALKMGLKGIQGLHLRK